MRYGHDSLEHRQCGGGGPPFGVRAAMNLVVLAICAGVCGAQVQQETPKPVDSGLSQVSPKPDAPQPADNGSAQTASRPEAPKPADTGFSKLTEFKGLDTVVSVRVSDMELAQALRLLHDASGINFAMGAEVRGKVTCSIKDKTARTVLNAFLEPNGYDYVEKDGVLIIQSASKRAKPETPPPGMQQGKIVRRSFTIPYLGSEILTDVVGGVESGGGGSTTVAQPAASKPMDQVIREMLSPAGKMVFYDREHLIIVEDYEQIIQNIADLVEQLWAVPAQIYIDSKLLEVDLNDDSAMGLQWQVAADPANRTNFPSTSSTSIVPNPLLSGNPGTALGGYTPTVPTFSGQSGNGFIFGISNQHVDIFLTALAARSRVDTRSNPRLLVVNHRKATIVAGEEVPYLTSIQSTGAEPIQTYSFKEVAVHLEVTPHASEDGMIFMDVHPTVKNVIGYTGSPAQPVLSVREASTSVVMPDATTLIIGGLLKRDVNKSWQEVPFLSRIPLIGWLFQQKAASDEKDDLIFLVNPRIVTPKLMKELARQNNAARLHDDMDARKSLRYAEPPEHSGESPADKSKW
ncbi:MAG: type II secretion system protein GspD [Candidatus Brocadiia bacterium]